MPENFPIEKLKSGKKKTNYKIIKFVKSKKILTLKMFFELKT